MDRGPRPFHDRPWPVLDADRFVTACLDAMADRALAAFEAIGAIDQFVDSTDVLGFRPAESSSQRRKLRRLTGELRRFVVGPRGSTWPSRSSPRPRRKS